jgi:CRISPR-associated protein (TIGR02710 family)
MTRFVLVSVGGSPDPILFSVESLRKEDPGDPPVVVFVCSVDPCPTPSLPQVLGEGFPCRHPQADGSMVEGANLLLQLDIQAFDPSRHLISIPDPDDLADAYQRIRDHIRILREESPGCRIFGDYTGGTKTMSAAMAMACVEQGVELGVVSGLRTNLQKVDQSENTRLMDIAPLHATHRLENQLRPILALHNYGEAAHVVSLFQEVHGHRISRDGAQHVEELRTALAVLQSWDQFQWRSALQQGKHSQLANIPDLLAWWNRVVIAGDCMETIQPEDNAPAGITGYELVQDLILSAERRGNRGWYDDAVARLYRALELLAETYISLELKLKQLRKYDQDRRRFQFVNASGERIDGPAARGVSNLYLWIRGYERKTGRESGLGSIFSQRKSQFEKLMTARNRSLLAHGLSPLKKERWQTLQADITFFVEEILHSEKITPGPPPHQLPGADLLSLPAARRLFGPEVVSPSPSLVRPTG